MDDIIALLSAAEEHLTAAERTLAEVNLDEATDKMMRYSEVMHRTKETKDYLASKKAALLHALLDAAEPHREEIRCEPATSRTAFKFKESEVICITPERGNGRRFDITRVSIELFAKNAYFWQFAGTVLATLKKHLEEDPEKLAKDAARFRRFIQEVQEMHFPE